MTNQEKKQELWEKLSQKFNHLDNYCKIELRGIDDDNVYFHPKFIIDDGIFITSQADIGTNKCIYALSFNIQTELKNFSIDITDELLEPIIIGYYTNKDVVMIALETLSKVRNHINQLNYYTTDYIQNILVGNSIKDITQQFIQELKATDTLISFMQKQKTLK